MGFWVDGICDLLGVTCMTLGITLYLKKNRPRRGYKGTPVSTLPYHPLKEINSSQDIEKDHKTDIVISYKTKVSFQRIVQVIGLFSGQMLLSSLAWNRYIDLYQNLLENCVEYDIVRRKATFKCTKFYVATGMWRIVNPHSYLHVLSLAVFFDKTWGFLQAVHYSGYIGLVIAAAASEYFAENIRYFVVNGSDV